jgi:hypothetical protein
MFRRIEIVSDCEELRLAKSKKCKYTHGCGDSIYIHYTDDELGVDPASRVFMVSRLFEAACSLL